MDELYGNQFFLVPNWSQPQSYQLRRCRRGWEWRDGVTHLGRRTNSIFIWNFHPDELELRYMDHQIWTETGDIYSWSEFQDILSKLIDCLDNVGKNIWFR